MSSTESENFAELDYLIYAPVPHKGYSIRAKTLDVVESAFTTAHKEILCPYDELLFSNLQIEARVVTQSSGSGPVYLSRISKRQRLDDLGRDGIVSTIVQVPSELLSSGQLAFKEVESVLLSSEREKPGVPIGQIPKLRVPVRMGNNDPDTAVMGTIFPQESANRLLSILAESDDSKAFVLFKTGSNDRNDLCLALGKFLHLAKQESFTITSDCPMDTFLTSMQTS